MLFGVAFVFAGVLLFGLGWVFLVLVCVGEVVWYCLVDSVWMLCLLFRFAVNSVGIFAVMICYTLCWIAYICLFCILFVFDGLHVGWLVGWCWFYCV